MSSREGHAIRVVGDVASEVVAPLGWLARLGTLEDVVHRDLAIVGVIVQDEFTHDVITRPGAAGAVHVVFDTT